MARTKKVLDYTEFTAVYDYNTKKLTIQQGDQIVEFTSLNDLADCMKSFGRPLMEDTTKPNYRR